jgi:hypothetical protein
MTEAQEQVQRLEHLQELRRGLLHELEEADQALSRLRMQVERAESELRIGSPAPENYDDLKGHRLPQAESRLQEVYRSLLKLEEKINATRRQLG